MIVYGTEPDRLKPDDAGVEQLRASLGIGQGDVLALAVGRMVPKKGFDVLVRAMAEPRLRGSRVVAALVGVGDEWERWQQLGRNLGVDDRLRWVGRVAGDRIGTFYNAADIMVMPAVTEPADGLNVCVLDAMSCGKPVVGSDVAGNPLAIQDGVTGLLVPERSPSSLRMGAAGRRRIDEELGWPVLVRRYIRRFEALSGTAARPA